MNKIYCVYIQNNYDIITKLVLQARQSYDKRLISKHIRHKIMKIEMTLDIYLLCWRSSK